MAQDRLWEVLEVGGLQLARLDKTDPSRVRALMCKYRDRPIDRAGAALVCVAERERLHTVLTTERSDFAVYRLHGRRRFGLIL